MFRRRPLILVLLTAFALVGAACGASASTAKSGLYGQVHIGPLCPVERLPPDPNCAPKALAGVTVLAKRAGSSRIAAHTKTSSQGRYRLALATGSYDLYVDAGMRRLASKVATAHVSSGRYLRVNLSVDSGIR